MAKIINPFPLFLDGRGALLDAGYLYVGTVNKDPTVPANQVPLFWDVGFTVPAPQPLRTLGGQIVHGQNPGFAYVNQTDYALTIQDADNVLVQYFPSFVATGDVTPNFQPLDSDLTSIAALATTSFGRSLLTLANAAALKAATGIPNCLPLTGGAMSGDIVRQGGGIYPYWTDVGITGGRIYLAPSNAADPTSQPGDIWFGY